MMRLTDDDATKFPKNSVELMFARTLNVNSFLADWAWYMFTVQREGAVQWLVRGARGAQPPAPI